MLKIILTFYINQLNVHIKQNLHWFLGHKIFPVFNVILFGTHKMATVLIPLINILNTPKFVKLAKNRCGNANVRIISAIFEIGLLKHMC